MDLKERAIAAVDTVIGAAVLAALAWVWQEWSKAMPSAASIYVALLALLLLARLAWDFRQWRKKRPQPLPVMDARGNAQHMTVLDGPEGLAQASASMDEAGLPRPAKRTPAEVAAIDQRQSDAFRKTIEGMERVLAQYDHLITGEQDDSLCTIFKKCIPDASGGSAGWEAFWGAWAGREHHKRFKAKVAALRGRLITPKDFEEVREAFEGAVNEAFILYEYLAEVSREGGSPSFVAQWEDFRAFMEGRGPFEGFLNFVANAREQNKHSKFEKVIFPAIWATKNQHGERYG